MKSVSKKGRTYNKAAYSILIIDDDEIVATRIRTLLSQNNKIRLKLVTSCEHSEIRQKIHNQYIDLIFYGLKASDVRNKWINHALLGPDTPPVIGLKDVSSSRVPSGIDFQAFILKNNLTLAILEETIYRYVYSVVKKRSIDDSIKELRASELRFLNIILKSPDGMIVVNKKNQILFVNPAAEALLVYTQNDPVPALLPFVPGSKNVQEVFIEKSGRCVEVKSTEIVWNTDLVILLSLRDITTRKKAELALKQSEKRYALAIKGSRAAVWDWDLKSDVFSCDARWQEMLGSSLSIDKQASRVWFSKIHVTDISKLKLRLKKHLEGKTEIFDCEYRILDEQKAWHWVYIRGEAIRNRNGQANRITGLQSDITERKKAERQLTKSLDDLRFALASEKILMDELDRKNKELIELSITDGLTGLYNHRFLQERFDFEYKRVKRYGGFLSCMMIDIDHFKMINDTYGHQFGDQVLRQMSDLLKFNSREVDICGRYGGEEFMMITNLQIEDTLKFATKLHTAIETHDFECGQKTIHVTVSIGISEYESEIKSKQQLIERADTALYQAKTDGRNLIRIWKKNENLDEYLVDASSTDLIRSKFMNLSAQMRLTYLESANALVKAVDAKDPFAREHSNNVSKYSVLIAEELGLCPGDIEIIRYAALLHDVGKISVKDSILTKRNALDQKELTILKRHPEVGVNILKDLKFLEKEIPIILHHHERFDGKGYPHGLKAKEIPVGARVVAVADAMDAMTSGRTYRKKLNWKLTINQIEQGSGNQFAPDVVDAAIRLFKCGKLGKL